jgi:hypothetical protein
MVRKISLKTQRVLREQYYDKKHVNYFTKLDKFHKSLHEQNVKISLDQLRSWYEKQNAKRDKYLHDIYYDTSRSSSFSNPEQFYKEIVKQGRYPISHGELQRWLMRQQAYLWHKQVKRQFKTSRITFPAKILFMMDIDTAVMSRYAKFNDNYSFMLVTCDPATLMIYAEPMKEQTGEGVVKAFKEIVNRCGKKPSLIRMDKHQSFKSKVFVNYLKQHNINFHYVYNVQKAVFAEVSIKTLKLRIARLMTFRKDNRYVPWLQNLVRGHNDTYSSTLGCAPSEVTEGNVYQVWLRRFLPYGQSRKSRKHVYRMGQLVHVSILKGVFTRQVDQKWSQEVFRIRRRYHRDGLPIYELSDMNGEKILGSFYQPEITPATDT